MFDVRYPAEDILDLIDKHPNQVNNISLKAYLRHLEPHQYDEFLRLLIEKIHPILIDLGFWWQWSGDDCGLDDSKDGPWLTIVPNDIK